MLQENVLVQKKPVTAPWSLPIKEREEILSVLDRAADDDEFIARFTSQGEAALEGYDLTWQEKAALLSGDVDWIESRVGKLDARLRTWLDCRLQQENW